MRERRAVWIVARHEYGRMVHRKAFLLMTFGLPLLYLVIFAFIIFFISRGSGMPLGYVDLAGVIPASPQMPEMFDREPPPVAFPDVESGKEAVRNGEIVGLYVLPSDYLRSGEVVLYVGERSPSEEEQSFFAEFIRCNLVSGVKDEAVRRRLLDGPRYVTRTVETGRLSGGVHVVGLAVAIGAAVVFYLLLMLSSNYLLQAVADEKANRTIEMLFTSISPRALIVGKGLGLTAVALTQLLSWGMMVVLGFLYFALRPGSSITLDPSLIPWGDLGIAFLFFLPSYLLLAAMMIALGAVSEDARQGQQLSAFLSLSFYAPLFFITQIITDPGGALAVGLSFFPTTAFLVLMIRRVMGVVPWWQVALSWVVLTASAAGMLIVAARFFRVWMLRYGSGLSLRKVREWLRGGRHA